MQSLPCTSGLGYELLTKGFNPLSISVNTAAFLFYSIDAKAWQGAGACGRREWSSFPGKQGRLCLCGDQRSSSKHGGCSSLCCPDCHTVLVADICGAVSFQPEGSVCLCLFLQEGGSPRMWGISIIGDT